MTSLYIKPKHNTKKFLSYVTDTITGSYPVVGEYLGTRYCAPKISQNENGSATITINTEFADIVGEQLTQAYINWGQSDKGPINISPSDYLQTQLYGTKPPQCSVP